MKNQKLRNAIKKSMATLGVMLVPFMGVPAHANPAGEEVVGGSASFQRDGSVLSIQTSDRAIINWNDFSIGSNELTQFFQPSSSSAVLNRVVSGNPSALLGTLNANGKLFLINPNGILVGEGATINTASFIASTFDVSNDEFMKGEDMTLTGDSAASIINNGTINAIGGDIHLFANKTVNNGMLSALDGTVGIGQGEVLLKQDGVKGFYVKPASLQRPYYTDVAVQNGGTIQAANVQLNAANGNLYALAINNQGMIQARGSERISYGRTILTGGGGKIQNSGTIQAKDLNGDGGRVEISAGMSGAGEASSQVINSGILSAKGEGLDSRGGVVQLTGQQVGLLESSVVDVTGNRGGGTALIGGDYQGKNASVQNAQETFVSESSVILADALLSGDGGKVIVWADQLTEYYGSIFARGGSVSGNGGFVETSGKINLAFDGMIDTSAVQGMDGTILLDPYDLKIDTVGSNNGQVNGSNPRIAFTGNPNRTSRISISAAKITGLSGSLVFQAYNTIDITTPLNFTKQGNGTTVTFSAGNDMVIQGTVETAGGNLVFESGDPDGVGSSSGFIAYHENIGSATTGNITFNSNGSQSVGARGWSDEELTPFDNLGSVDLPVGSWGIMGFGDITTAAGKSVTVNSSGNVLLLGNFTAPGNMSINSRGNDVTIGGIGVVNNQFAAIAGAINNQISFTNSKDVTILNTAATKLGTSNIHGNLYVESAGAIDDNARLIVDGMAKLIATGGAAITLDQAANQFGSIGFTGVNAVMVETGDTTLEASTLTGTLNVTSTGNIADNGKLAVAGNTTLTSNNGNGDINLDEIESTFGTLILTGKNVSLVENADSDIGNSQVGGSFYLKSAGAITDSSATANVTGIATFEAATSLVLDQINLLNDVYVKSGTSLSFGAARTLAGNLNVNVNNGLTQTVALQSAKGITIKTNGDFIQDANLTSGNDMSLFASGALTQNAARVTTVGNGRDLSMTAANGALVLNGSFGAGIDDLTLSSLSDMALNKAFTLTGNLRAESVGGQLTVTSSENAAGIYLTSKGDLTQSAVLTGNDVALISTGGGLILNNGYGASVKNLTLSSFNSLTLGQALSPIQSLSVSSKGGDLTVNNPLSSQNVHLSARNDLTVNQTLTATDLLEFTFGTEIFLNSAYHYQDLTLNVNNPDYLLGAYQAPRALSINAVDQLTLDENLQGGQVFVNAKGDVFVNSQVTASGDLVIQSGDQLTLKHAITGGLVSLVGDSFTNLGGAHPIQASDRFLIYTTIRSNNHLNGLEFDFQQFGLEFPVQPTAFGNGLLYSQISADDLGLFGIGVDKTNEEQRARSSDSREDLTQLVTTLQYSVDGLNRLVPVPGMAQFTTLEYTPTVP